VAYESDDKDRFLPDSPGNRLLKQVVDWFCIYCHIFDKNINETSGILYSLVMFGGQNVVKQWFSDRLNGLYCVSPPPHHNHFTALFPGPPG